MPNLVGIGNSQVPTNAMLGGLAYQDTDNAVLKKVEIDKITAIKTKINTKWKYGNGAVANSSIRGIFVYDTRGDSDGGAWRKRTQNCSWYNETLNTAYRGSRKEFPSIAVLVSHEGNNFGFSIYDGDDPNLPMWMHFPIDQYAPSSNWGSGIPFIGRANFVSYQAGPISALNGQIAMGNEHTNGDYQPGWMVNMISEKCLDVVDYGTGGSGSHQTYWMSSNISNRVNYDAFVKFSYNGSRYGTGDALQSRGKSGITGRCENGEIRAIEMKVTPDALTDEDTGLPVPTQAWAGKEGISVMKGSTNSWVTTRSSTHTEERAAFNSKFDIHTISRHGSAPNCVQLLMCAYPDYNTLTSTKYYHSNRSCALDATMGTVFSGEEDLKFMKNPYGGVDDLAVIPSSQVGLNLYLGDGIDGTASNKSTIMARITPDYNTGWMMGACDIAAMCDTSTATIAQSVHVDEGFSATGSWTFADNASISSGKLNLPNTQNARATHATFLQANTSYMCRYLVSNNNMANWQFDDDNGGSLVVYQDITFSQDGTHSFVFKTTASTKLRIMRTQTGSSGTITIDYIRFYKIDQDTHGVLGCNNRGISKQDHWFGFATIGTGIVRNSVSRTSASISPTGIEGKQSDVVAYSSWGSSSYLVRGYASDLDIGTNSFVVSGWVFPPTSTNGDQPMFGVGRSDLNDGFLINLNDGPNWTLECGYLGTNNSFNTSTGGTNVRGDMQGERWNQFAIWHTGSNIRMYVNGQYCGQWGDSSVNWSTRWVGKQIMTIGARAGQFGGGSSGGGSFCAPDTRLAMFRFGEANDEWSDEMFRMIYEDEKHLFVAGAKAVLTGGLGSSHRVKDIDYDTRTNTLHATGQYGTSEFKRLVRINNTTNPSSLVSAQGGMVAEINF